MRIQPAATARIVIAVSAAIDPRYTGSFPYFMERIIATKKVLSPHSPINIKVNALLSPTQSEKGAAGCKLWVL